MALDKTILDPTASGSKGNVHMASYGPSTDTLATILADGYFDTVATAFRNKSLIYVQASDGEGLYEVTVSGGDVALGPVAASALVQTLDSAGEVGVAHGTIKLSGAVEFKIGAPVPGVEVDIVKSDTSTGGTTLVPNDTGDISFDFAGNRKLTFDAQDEAVKLKGLSATQFAIMSNVGSVAAAST